MNRNWCSVVKQKLFRSIPSVNTSPICHTICNAFFDFKRPFTKTRFRCNFCSDKSVQTWFGPFQKSIRYGTFHFQQFNRAVLFKSRKCLESSISSVNRSPVQFTLCDSLFHWPVQVWTWPQSSILPHPHYISINGRPLWHWISVLDNHLSVHIRQAISHIVTSHKA